MIFRRGIQFLNRIPQAHLFVFYSIQDISAGIQFYSDILNCFRPPQRGDDGVEKGPERGQEVSKLPLSESAKSTGGEYVANRPVLRYRMVIFYRKLCSKVGKRLRFHTSVTC